MTEIIKPESAINRAYNQLRTSIIKCELAPGSKLKIESLKTMLNTGGSPIRESLSLLTSDALVQRIDQRGFCVTPISQSHYQEILMLRCTLENIALRQSIEQGDNAWEDRLIVLHHRLNRTEILDFDTREDQHKLFHMALIENCNSPILLKICNNLYDQNIRYRFLAERTVQYKQRNVSEEHTEILNAVLDKNLDLACNLLIKHYEGTGVFLNNVLGQDAINGWNT